MTSTAHSSPMLDLDSPAASIVGSEAPLAKKKGFMGMFGSSKSDKVKPPKVKKVPIPFTSGVALKPSAIGYTPRVRAALGSSTPPATPAPATGSSELLALSSIDGYSSLSPNQSSPQLRPPRSSPPPSRPARH